MNKKLLLNILSLTALIFFSNEKIIAQNIAVNASGIAANLSSMLDISSGTGSNRGLLIPRVTAAQKTAMNPLPAAAQGLTVYQTDGVEGFYYNTSVSTTPAWSYLTPGGWSLLGNAGTTAGTNFIGTTDAVDWVITNPPFRLAEEFVIRSFDVARHGVAMLVRTVFLESVGRYNRLFRNAPPSQFAQFVERVPMVKGRLDGKASTATGYAWLVWNLGESDDPKVVWIPPCRKRLEKRDDYSNIQPSLF